MQNERLLTPLLSGDASASRANGDLFGDAFTKAWSSVKGGEVEAEAREAATQFVASAFIMPVLAMRHENTFAAEPFAPNSAQQRFAPMLDWQLADRIASASEFPLVDAIVKRIMEANDMSRAEKGSLDVTG